MVSFPAPVLMIPLIIDQEYPIPEEATYCAVVSSHKVSGPMIIESGLPLMKTLLLALLVHPY